MGYLLYFAIIQLEQNFDTLSSPNRAVTTIEEDDFLKKTKKTQTNKQTKQNKEKERERKKKSKRQDIDFCSSKAKSYIRYVMPFRIYFCVRCRMLFRIYFCSQSNVGSFITDFQPY